MRKLAVLRLLWFGSERNCLLSTILKNALAACVVHYPCMKTVSEADYGSLWGGGCRQDTLSHLLERRLTV
jgi:hypothetical protein